MDDITARLHALTISNLATTPPVGLVPPSVITPLPVPEAGTEKQTKAQILDVLESSLVSRVTGQVFISLTIS